MHMFHRPDFSLPTLDIVSSLVSSAVYQRMIKVQKLLYEAFFRIHYIFILSCSCMSQMRTNPFLAAA